MKHELLASVSTVAVVAASTTVVVEAAHNLHWDIEARSFADLTDVGAARYAADPSTEVTVVSYTVDDGPLQYCIPGRDPIPEVFFTAARDPSWRISSHNDGFETAITVHILGPRFGWPLVPVERRICTMAAARYYGLPGALEKVAERLKLPVQKDVEGRRLMLKLSRPGKDGKFIEPTEDELKRLIAYCCRDTEIEREVFYAVPELPASEQALWVLDRRINDRGFMIDTALATRACTLVATEKENINTRLRDITDNAVNGFTKVKAIRDFVNARGLNMTALDKRAVAAELKQDIDNLAREVLELRQAAASNTEAKFVAALATAFPDRRIRGLLTYYGTHTGRWSSSGFNVHNLPREAGDHVGEVIAAIQAGDLERLRKLGAPLSLIASAIRGLVIAPSDKRLLIGDFSTIEPRLAAWLAGETWKIENFFEFDRTGDPMLDSYRVLGAKMRGVPVDPNDKATRQHGKTVTMAFTFGAGPNVWRRYVPDDPRTDDEIKAQEVNQFRQLHPRQTRLMNVLDAQALRCVASRKPITGDRYSFAMDGDTLMLTLPSGRKLFYPQVRLKPGKFGSVVIAYYSAAENCEVEMWRGTWIAHLVSATARDLLVNALHKLDAAGFEIILSVHDEVIAEVDAEAVDTEAFQRCMLDAPAWAEGLPLAAEVRSGTRFIKAETARSAELEPGEIVDASAVPPTNPPHKATAPAPKPVATAAAEKQPTLASTPPPLPKWLFVMLGFTNRPAFAGSKYGPYKSTATPGETYGPYRDREALLSAFLIRCVREGLADEAIIWVCIDERFKDSKGAIHTHCREQMKCRGDLERRIAQAKATTVAAPATSKPQATASVHLNGHTHAQATSQARNGVAGITLSALDAGGMVMIDLADLISEKVPKNRKICCPFHAETRPSLHIYSDHYYCFGCHAYGDHIDWLTQVEGLSLTAAAEMLANWTGPVISRSTVIGGPTEEDIEAAEKDRAYVLRWWDASNPIKGTLAATYLAETRGIDLDLLPDNVDDALRFHKRCVFGPGVHHPCLIALMRDARGDAPIGIQRIALTSDAQKIDRRMLGTAGVVKLWPAAKQLVIGEGLETVLAAATRLPYRGEPLRPAWATLSDGAMKYFPIIDGVERLIILADNDANGVGQKAAAECRQRWRVAGRRGAVLMPPRPGSDFNDLVLERRAGMDAATTTATE